MLYYDDAYIIIVATIVRLGFAGFVKNCRCLFMNIHYKQSQFPKDSMQRHFGGFCHRHTLIKQIFTYSYCGIHNKSCIPNFKHLSNLSTKSTKTLNTPELFENTWRFDSRK